LEKYVDKKGNNVYKSQDIHRQLLPIVSCLIYPRFHTPNSE